MNRFAIAAVAALVSTTAATVVNAGGFDEGMTPECALLYNNVSYPRLGQIIGAEEIAKVMKLRGEHATDDEIGKVMMGWLYDGKITGDELFGSIVSSMDIVAAKSECSSALDQAVLTTSKANFLKIKEQMQPMLDAIARPKPTTTTN